MNKRFLKTIIIFILLFSIGISTVFAATPIFTTVEVVISDLKSSNLISTDWSDIDEYVCAGNPGAFSDGSNSSHCKPRHTAWNLYSVKEGNKYYTVYCLHLSKNIEENAYMIEHDGLDSIRNITDSKKTLLKQLLLYGYNPNTNTSKPLSDVVRDDPKVKLRLMAMQILIWEIMEGGRTSFNSIAPNNYEGDLSYYEVVVKPNGYGSSKTGTLYYYYSEYVKAVRDAIQRDTSATAFNTTHKMTWKEGTNGSGKYQVTLSPSELGNYTSCSAPSNSGVTVSSYSSTSGITISSSNKITNNVNITCSYKRGNGASNNVGESFRYFTFDVDDIDDYQDMIYGSGWIVYSKQFNVISESTKIKINKIDGEGKSISNDTAEFTLTHIKNNKSIKVTANDSAKTLDYSGEYRVSETKAPSGYRKIDDFRIDIDASTGKVTKCNNSRSSNGVIVSCLNELVLVTYSNDNITLSIKNDVEHFEILKTNASGTVINGKVEYEIRNSSNNVVKFTKTNDNIYKYDTSGSITKLTGASAYKISLLPDGNYKIIETKAPDNYFLPSDEKSRTTNITISKGALNSSSATTVKIKNYTTQFSIHKIGNNTPLEGVEFELYNEDRTVKLKCNPVAGQPGVYNYVENQNAVNNSVYVTNSSGNITFNYLPEGTYWVKETKTLLNYDLPLGDAAYTSVTIKYDPQKGIAINNSYTIKTIEISNTPFTFNFYKRDTDGNPLNTGMYKLQKYDKESNRYVDLKLVEVQKDDNSIYYKVDNKNGKVQFKLSNQGTASFINMTKSTTYRIIETVAPEGYTKASTKDTATVHLDENGYASGLLVLVDQKIVKEDDSAYAELIINIQTGKQRVMYAAVITIVIGIIAALIIYNKKK